MGHSMKIDYEREKKHARQKKIIIRILIWIVEIVAVIGLAYIIVNVALEKTTVLGDSMQITLQADEKIMINKLAYRFSDPKRYDIIVFKQSGDEHNYYNIKRVIGLPGEKVRISGGKVYINDELLDEPMIVEDIQIPGLAADEIVLEKDEYFVLGDNRNNSEDSRFANIGNVVEEEIIGKVWIRLSPFDFVSKINMYDKVEETPNESSTSK